MTQSREGWFGLLILCVLGGCQGDESALDNQIQPLVGHDWLIEQKGTFTHRPHVIGYAPSEHFAIGDKLSIDSGSGGYYLIPDDAVLQREEWAAHLNDPKIPLSLHTYPDSGEYNSTYLCNEQVQISGDRHVVKLFFHNADEAQGSADRLLIMYDDLVAGVNDCKHHIRQTGVAHAWR